MACHKNVSLTIFVVVIPKDGWAGMAHSFGMTPTITNNKTLMLQRFYFFIWALRTMKFGMEVGHGALKMGKIMNFA